MIALAPLLPDIDFARDELSDLHEVLVTLRAAGAVVPVRYFGETVWLITRYAELKQAFSDEEHFPAEAAYTVHSEPAMGKTLQTMSGERHRVNRALVSRPFFPKAVRELVGSLIEPVADELLERIADRDEVDLVQAFTRPYPFTVITRMLGIPVDDEDKLLTWALKLIDYPWDPQGALKARQEFADYVQPIIDERRAQPGTDVISLLTSAEFEGQRLGDEEIHSFLRLLFPAGSDTTFKIGGSMFHAILSDLEVRDLALRGAAERAAIVQEALRWQPPTALLPRRCARDTQLGGMSIAAGDWVLFGVTAANSDPAVFPDPRRFDPARRDKNLAFGHGEHFCLGSHLARSELEIAIERVLRRFPDIRLMPERPARFSGAVMRGTPELWVRLRGKA